MKELPRLSAIDESQKENVIKSLGLRRLYRVILVANLMGLGTIGALNFLTPLDYFRVMRVFIARRGGWEDFGLFWSAAVPLGFLLHSVVLRPLRRLKKAFAAEESRVPPGPLLRMLRRLLNLPMTCAIANVGIWILLALLLSLYAHFIRDASFMDCLFIFSRFFLIGLVTAGLSFFLVEDHLRTNWVPVFFPEGRLFQIPGAVTVPVARRIRVLWGAGTLNPMIILVVTLLFVVWEEGSATPSVRAITGHIYSFTLMLCVVYTAIALRLNLLVAKSIRGPLVEILKALKGVRDGDLTRRVTVVSNDELGIVGDAANQMIRGLADRERIRETFGRYMTPEIRDHILAGRVPLGGERRVATVVFSDLRDFTPYVEETAPEEVIASMKAYFTAMQRVIRQHGGLVFQFVGDEIEAAFGVPIPTESHADDALRAALAMRNALAELNDARSADGKPPFRHGIGIHTGMVLAGNTGSEDHLSYALIGDTVNLASRIQDLTKSIDSDILVSAQTVASLKGSFEMRMEPSTTVKGHSKPVVVYSVVRKEGESRSPRLSS